MNATDLLSLLPLLACPLAMGGMMWLMTRMNKGQPGIATPPPRRGRRAGGPPGGAAGAVG